MLKDLRAQKNPQGQAVQVTRIRFSQYLLSALQAGKAIKSARGRIVTNVKHSVGEIFQLTQIRQVGGRPLALRAIWFAVRGNRQGSDPSPNSRTVSLRAASLGLALGVQSDATQQLHLLQTQRQPILSLNLRARSLMGEAAGHRRCPSFACSAECVRCRRRR